MNAWLYHTMGPRIIFLWSWSIYCILVNKFVLYFRSTHIKTTKKIFQNVSQRWFYQCCESLRIWTPWILIQKMIKGINIPICLGTLFFIILFTFFVYIICSESTEPKEERDDLINPFWIEDRDLGRGEVDHLSGVEIQFWKDLIDKYLSPIDADKKREVRYSKSYFFTYLF